MEKEKPVKEINGKSECPSCKSTVKNLKIHFRKSNECGDRIDKEHFDIIFEKVNQQQKE